MPILTGRPPGIALSVSSATEKQEIEDAFWNLIREVGGVTQTGYTKERWVEFCLYEYVKSNVKTDSRTAYQTQMTTAAQAIATRYGTIT